MNSNFENGVLTIFPEDKIDSNNAEDFGAQVAEIRAANPEQELVVDFENLGYISSAGLRQMLKLKKSNANMKIINVSPDVYEVFDMTGFTEMMDIEKGYRKMDVSGCEVIGEGSNGIVYRYSPDIICKVYKNKDALDDIKKERELARKALVMGVNTAIPYDVVKVGEYYASVFELLSSKSLSKFIVQNPDDKDKYIRIFADFLKGVHGTVVEEGALPSEKKVVLGWVEWLDGKIDDAHYQKLKALVEAVPEDNHMIHGDYHTNNIHYDGEEAIIIDMDTLSVGHPVFEMGSIYNAYQGFSLVDHAQVERFLKMDFETATYIWKKFLTEYYGKEDTSLEETKAKVVGLTRILRRTLKREPDNTALIEESRKQLLEAIDAVDTLL